MLWFRHFPWTRDTGIRVRKTSYRSSRQRSTECLRPLIEELTARSRMQSKTSSTFGGALLSNCASAGTMSLGSASVPNTAYTTGPQLSWVRVLDPRPCRRELPPKWSSQNCAKLDYSEILTLSLPLFFNPPLPCSLPLTADRIEFTCVSQVVIHGEAKILTMNKPCGIISCLQKPPPPTNPSAKVLVTLTVFPGIRLEKASSCAAPSPSSPKQPV